MNDKKIKAFINKYVDDTEISSEDDYSVVRDFYDWFTGGSPVDFSKMCWNAPV
jgi:hypothetical protein